MRADFDMALTLKAFLQDDDGAITVDFVVLTAAICILGFLVVTSVSAGTIGLTNNIVNALANTPTD